MSFLNRGALLGALGTALLIAACGSSSSTSSSSGAGNDNSGTVSSSSAGGGDAAADLKSVARLVHQAQSVPKWTAPGLALDGAKLRGKSIYVIPITSQSSFELEVEQADRVLAAKAGVKLTFYTNQGAPSQYVAGMNQAIAAKPSAILLESGVSPDSIGPQILAATKAGIPVIDTHVWDASDPQAPNCEQCANLSAVVKGPFRETGRDMADWVINDSKGKADVLLAGLQGVISSPEVEQAEEAEFKKYCPACKVKLVTETLAQLADSPNQGVSTALSADAKINYVIPTFDALVPGVLGSLNTSDRASGVKLVSFGGTTTGMADVANSNNPMQAEVAEPIAWAAAANLDQTFRLILGMKQVQEATPARLFTKGTISEAGSAPDYDTGFGTAFHTGFLKLWNLG